MTSVSALEPKDCSYQVFDLISDEYVEIATAKYSSRKKILELSNVEEDRGYALKIDGEEMAKFVINTAHFNDSYTGNITVGGKFARNIDVPLKFLSTLLVRGTVYT